MIRSILPAMIRPRRLLAPSPGLISLLLPALLPPSASFAQAAFGGGGGHSGGGFLGVDLIGMVRTADMLGKLSLVLLGVFSLASWAVIIYKWLHIRQATSQSDAFVRACNHTTGQLEDAYKAASEYPDSPLAQILREAYIELEVENWFGEGYNLDQVSRVELAKISLERVVDRTITNEISHLESKLIFLAITTNICPFIGLFGTVWGIMAAFQGLGSSSTVSIAALAPGLATALLVTIAGLFCAIPSAFAYNLFATRVRTLTSRMDAFGLELVNIIQKQIIKQGVRA